MSHMPTTAQPEGAPAVTATRQVTTSGGLAGGGTLSSDLNLSIADGGVTTPKIADGNVTFVKLPSLPAAGFIGAPSAGNAQHLTATQATALLDAFTSGAKGVVPASGGGNANSLFADGSWGKPVDVIDLRKHLTFDSAAAASANTTAWLALVAANPTGKTFQLPMGTLYLARDTTTGDGLPITGERFLIAAGGSVISGNNCSNLTLRGWGPGLTKIVLTGDQGGLQSRVVRIHGGVQGVTIRDLTIEHDTAFTNPQSAQLNHLLQIECTEYSTRSTRDIRVINVNFGACVGDAIRIVGPDTKTKVFTAAVGGVCTTAAHNLSTGDGPFVMSTTGTKPGGSYIGKQYWIKKLSANTYSLHPSRADAVAGTNIVAFTTTGTGTHTLTTDAWTEDVFIDQVSMRLGNHPAAASYINTDTTQKGARSGFALQTGVRRVYFSNFAISGVKNSLIDCEPSGGAIYDCVIGPGTVDNSDSDTIIGVSISGNNTTQNCNRMLLDRVQIVNGILNMAYSRDTTCHKVKLVANGQGPLYNNTTPLIFAQQENYGITIEHTDVVRGAGCAQGRLASFGGVAGCERLHIHGGDWVNEVGAGGTDVQSVNILTYNGVRIKGLRLHNSYSSLAGERGILFRMATGTCDYFEVDDCVITSPNSDYGEAVYITANSGTINGIAVRNSNFSGSATRGVLFRQETTGTIEKYPMVIGNNFDNVTTPWLEDFDGNSVQDSPATVFPITGGNRNARRDHEGYGAPGFTAPKGSTYRRLDGGAGSTLYINETGTNVWAAK